MAEIRSRKNEDYEESSKSSDEESYKIHIEDCYSDNENEKDMEIKRLAIQNVMLMCKLTKVQEKVDKLTQDIIKLLPKERDQMKQENLVLTKEYNWVLK